MKDRSVECGPATYVQCEFRHPATKTQDPREVHDHDPDITRKDTIQWRPWNPAVLWQRKNRSARRKNCRTRPNGMMQIPNPRFRIARPGGTATTPTNLT